MCVCAHARVCMCACACVHALCVHRFLHLYVSMYVSTYVCMYKRENREGRNSRRESMYVCMCVCPPVYVLSVFLYISFLSRALELAVKHKTHVDTVLAFRQKYLKDLNSEESLKKFKQYSQQVIHHPPLQY